MINLVINKKSTTPIYQQIIDSIISLIENDALRANAKLPSTRLLSQSLNINRSTVCRAYEELNSLGYINSKSGSYSTVEKRRKIQCETNSKPPKWIDKTNDFQCFLPPRSENDIIDFSNSTPDIRLLSTNDFRKCINDVIKEDENNDLFLYGNKKGYKPLREYISKLMSYQNMQSVDENTLITNGANAALELICHLFGRNIKVIVESPSYPEAISIFKLFDAEIFEVPITNNGMDKNILEYIVSNNSIDFIYTMPNFQNPTGYSSSQENREWLLHISEKYCVPIIEDGFTQGLKGTTYPIKSMDTNNNIIYVGTFSKTFYPGIRIGWITAHTELIERLSNLSYICKISNNNIMQAALYKFCKLGLYEKTINKINREYQKRMNLALTLLESNLPSYIEFTRPKGGYFIWINLKQYFKVDDQFIHSLELRGILVKNGSKYYLNEANKSKLRISIAKSNKDEIERGLKILCKSIKEEIKNEAHFK